MKYLRHFESKKNKFPDIKKIQIDGYLVMVGRDAKSNDYLTFIEADDEDIWMHVKGIPGSHVIIRVRENLPTPEILKYVAELAKKNSKAQKDNQSIVVYCQRKFVKKEPGMNDGQVKVDYRNAEEIII
jgi:predicted ribosome quality control (RQC) complex YloA/Tae2 family protein